MKTACIIIFKEKDVTVCGFVFTNVQTWEAIIFYFPGMHCQEMDRAEWALLHIQGYWALKHTNILQRVGFANSVFIPTCAFVSL